MEFKKYNSIENVERTGFISKIFDEGHDKGEWIQTLKIHGSNYSINVNDESIIPATRKNFLNRHNNQFYWGKNYEPNAREMFLYVKSEFPDLKEMRIVGEVFGGMYYHPDVERDKHAKRFQKEVQYCPHNDFNAFDICVDDHYVSHDLFSKMCKMFEIPTVPELARGTFNDLILNPVEFPDPLYKRYNLPEIEGNIAEGWVMKPVEVRYLKSRDRVMIKGKNSKFKEQNKWTRTPKPSIELDDSANEIKEVLFSYITENRLRNVLSHGIVVNDKTFGKILGEFAQDVLTDFLKDHSLEWGNTSEAQCRVIRKLMNKEAGELIRVHWMDILDQNFF